MSAEQIQRRITDFLTKDLSIAEEGELELDTNLLTGGYLDSINAMRLVSHIEAEFQTKIPPRDLIPSNFLSIQAITSYLAQR